VKKLLIAMVVLLMTLPAYAQTRGFKKNVWASWYNVSTDPTTVTLPYESRDLIIINGDSTDAVCVNLKGGTITAACHPTDVTGAISIVNLSASTQLEIQDHSASTITLRAISAGSGASPVIVISSY